MNSIKYLTFFLLGISTSVFSQSNHILKPVEHPLFSNLNADYYYLVRSTLLKNEYPTIALLKTSHLPESILYVSFEMDKSEYFLNYKVAKSSIWEKYYSNSKKKIEVSAWKTKIDSDSYNLLKILFDYNLYKARFDPYYKQYFDGEQYLFTSERKTAYIEGVAESSDVAKTIKICDKILALIKDNKSNVISFSAELKNEIKELVEP